MHTQKFVFILFHFLAALRLSRFFVTLFMYTEHIFHAVLCCLLLLTLNFYSDLSQHAFKGFKFEIFRLNCITQSRVKVELSQKLSLECHSMSLCEQ